MDIKKKEDNEKFLIPGIKIEKNMDKNLKDAIIKYNLVHKKLVEDLKNN